MSNRLVEYVPPPWLKNLKNVPKYRVELAMGPTPVHEWKPPGIPEGFKVGIKRHDMTGSTLSGNKVEKLEFLLADAMTTGCRHVLTCGSAYSNMCRVTALSCRQLGLVPHLFIMTDVKSASELGCESNLFLNRLSGAHMYLVPKPVEDYRDIYSKMETLMDKILKETGEKSYFIPAGASNALGIFGSIGIIEQLFKQGVMDQYDDVVMPCGTCGTVAGMSIANYLAGSPLKVHGVVVSTLAHVHTHVNHELHNLGTDDVRSEDILDIIDVGLGRSVATQEELDYIVDVSAATGIVLDPVYTGRAAWAMMKELNNNPGRFKGRRILFIHTGGIFGLFDGRMDGMLKKPGAVTNNITNWFGEVMNDTK